MLLGRTAAFDFVLAVVLAVVQDLAVSAAVASYIDFLQSQVLQILTIRPTGRSPPPAISEFRHTLLGSACAWVQSIALYSHYRSESVCSPAMMILQHGAATRHLSETCRNGVPRHHKSGLRPLTAPFQPGCLSQMAATRTRRPNHTTAAVAAPDQSAAPEQEAEAAPEQQPEVAPAPADAAEPAAPSYDVPKLADLQLQAIVNPKVCWHPACRPCPSSLPHTLPHTNSCHTNNCHTCNCHFQQGRVAPEIQPGTAAAVFAVYDNHQKLQYIGFSKDLTASLKTVLGRRPDKAFFFK